MHAVKPRHIGRTPVSLNKMVPPVPDTAWPTLTHAAGAETVAALELVSPGARRRKTNWTSLPCTVNRPEVERRQCRTGRRIQRIRAIKIFCQVRNAVAIRVIRAARQVARQAERMAEISEPPPVGNAVRVAEHVGDFADLHAGDARVVRAPGVNNICNCELVTALVKTSEIGIFIPPAAA